MSRKHHAFLRLCLGAICFGGFLFAGSTFSQNSPPLAEIRNVLDSMAQVIPGLNDPTTLSMQQVSVPDYIRAIGIEHKINIDIEDNPTQLITSNLDKEPVKDIFLLVCKKYAYQIEVVGTILQFIPYEPPPPAQDEPAGPQPLDILFEDGKLSVDLKGDSLLKVLRELSQLTGRKLLAEPGTEGRLTAFLPPTALDTALEAIFLTNGYYLQQRRKGYQVVKKLGQTQANSPSVANLGGNISGEAFTDGDQSYIRVDADYANLEILIRYIFEQVDEDYLIYEKLEGEVSLHAELSALDELLHHLLQGTAYTFKKEGKLYLIGQKDQDGLHKTEIVHLGFRPTYQAMDLIPGGGGSGGARVAPGRYDRNQARPQNQGGIRNPNNVNDQFTNPNGGNFYPSNPYGNGFGNMFNTGSNLSTSPPPEIEKTTIGQVEVIEYPELNRIILKGPSWEVDELAAYLKEIDQPVPMVRLEMIVVEVNKNRLLSTGLEAGLKGDNDTLAKIRGLLPGIDYTLDGDEINELLGSVPALAELGVLSSNFYLNLKAQETRGNLKVRMNPVLSMLNGREASLTIGQTQYYLLETQTASTGAVNNFQTFTQRFERIEANVTLTVRPYISEDEMVTLDVLPDFTTPVGQFSSDVPPTIATRSFASTIRVKNGETVILGGLTEE
ncbi:MAG: hypothetical protein AAFR61_25635, partial [Bacteroidota bacterium]